jgi:hypothetical protein
MATLELTDEQVVHLIQQLPADQKKRVFDVLTQPVVAKPRPVFGRGKEHILSIADDFDAPLDDFKDYME